MTSRARTLASGATLLYSAQLATVLVQFIYAGLTSRLVDDTAYGAYAVSLSVSAIVILLSNGGLGQTVGRMQHPTVPALRALVLLALLLGAAGATILLTTAEFWAAVWATPTAVAPIRWLAMSAFAAPFLGLSTGLLRREGRFRSLARSTVIANIAGMTVGAIAVAILRTPSSLLVSPILAQIVLALSALALSRPSLAGVAALRHAQGSLMFSWQVTLQNLAHYVNIQAGPWITARFFSPDVLGQWNRADVATTVPLQQVQTAMTQALYPEFRHDIRGPERARTAWPDLLGAVAWVMLPAAGAAVFIIPSLVPLLFGEGWGLAAEFTRPLIILGGVQVVVVLLASAVEALGRYRWVWYAVAVRFIGVGTGAALAMLYDNFWFVLLGIGMGLIGLHLANIIACSRSGYLDLWLLVRHYAGALAAAIAVGGLTWILTYGLEHLAESPGLSVTLVVGVALVGALAWRVRNHLPPVQMARKYGLIRALGSV